MALIKPAQSSFAGGEYSPSIYPRIDIDKYKTGLRTARNFIIHPQGGASNRSGFQYISSAKFTDSMCVAQEFIFSQTQAYTLEVGDRYIRFYTDGARIELSGTPYEVATPYLEADLSTLKFESSADVIFITHPNYKTRTLSRFGNTNWVLDLYNPDDGPFMPENTIDSSSLTASATTGTVTLTASAVSIADPNALALLHMDGTNTSTTFTDATGRIWTANGNAQISTAQSVFGGASGLFDGTGDYIRTANSSDFAPGTGDFTFGTRIRLTSVVVGTTTFAQTIIDVGAHTGAGFSIALRGASSGANVSSISIYDGLTMVVTCAWTPSTGTWYHLAVVRYLGAIKIYINGVSQTLTTNTNPGNTLDKTSGFVDIGYTTGESDASGVKGYLDESKWSLSAEWTSDFTPPTVPYSITQTSSDFSFVSGQVGALFKLRHYIQGQTVSQAFTSTTTSSGIKCFTTWRIITHGTWTGKFYVEKSSDGGVTWTVLRQFSSANDFNANTSGTEDIETNPDPFLVRINFYVLSSGTANVDLTTDAFYQEGIVRITQFNTALSVRATVIKEIGATTATNSWSEGSWSDFRGYPTVSRFYQDRLVFASTPSEPQTVWMTQTGNYYSFFRHSTLLDTDGISVNLPSRQLNSINGLIAFKKLLAFTSSSVWSIGPLTGSALTPTSVSQDIEEYSGSSNISPVVIGTEAIYSEFGGEILRNIGFQLQSDGFVGSEINVLAKHLFEGYSIIKIAYQRNPNSVVWVLRSDGVLLGMTYLKEQEVVAWAHQDTDGDIKSICVIPSDTGLDELWAVIERDNGVYMEKMSGRRQFNLDDQYFLDSYTIFNNSTLVLSGLDRLRGETVSIIADGTVLTQKTVSMSGTLGMSSTYTLSAVGLPYNSDLETLDVEVPSQIGTMQGSRVKIGNVTFRLLNSRGGYVGPDENNLYNAFTYAALNNANGGGLAVTDNFSGDIRVPLGAGNQKGGRVFYRQTDPLPVSIGSIIPEINPGGTST